MPESAIIDSFPLWIWLAAAAALLVGGIVKGAVGFALPMLAVSAMSTFMPPHVAVALAILPTFVTNVWQSMRQGLGPALRTAREFWRLNLILVLVILIVSQLVPKIPVWIFFLCLGSIITLAAMVQLLGFRPRQPKSTGGRYVMEAATGVIGGICGGMAAMWGPPVLLYLLSLNLEKVHQLRAQGLIYLIGSIVLVGGHISSGILDHRTIPASALMVLPVLVGMWIGTRIQDRLDPVQFRRLTLLALLVAGLNLLRRGLF